jgi:hypothetical protein
VPEALRAAGVEIRVHDELFPQGTEDVVWLQEAGVNDWIVITRDDRIRYNQLEKQAVIAARLRFFSITSSSLTGEEAATPILSALDKMSRMCRQHSRAWIHREDFTRPRCEDYRDREEVKNHQDAGAGEQEGEQGSTRGVPPLVSRSPPISIPVSLGFVVRRRRL